MYMSIGTVKLTRGDTMENDSVLDKFHEECGVFGIFDTTLSIGKCVYEGLRALQHRGQESAGIVVSSGNRVTVEKGMGLVEDALADLDHLRGHIGIGHVRYATTGASEVQNIQPLLGSYKCGNIGLAHNGNLTNTLELRKDLEGQGAVFETTTDSEIILHMLGRSKEKNLEERIKKTCRCLEGAYSLVIFTGETLIGVRDPQGYRPLCIGKTKHGYILASESCAIDAVHGTFLRDVKAGEIVIIDEKGIHSSYISETVNNQHTCVFEYIYFARPDSVIDGQGVYESRFEMGRQLARETQYEADIVMPIPSSGTAAALGYAQESGIPYMEGLVRHHKIGRTFIKPNQEARELAVRQKMGVLPHIVQGKRIIVVDDSIVRGTTSKIIVDILRQGGAKEIYLCISSEPIQFPCYYGIDTSEQSELIAYGRSLEEIRNYIGVDKLYYISHDGLVASMKAVHPSQLCLACFNGHYTSNLLREVESGDTYDLQ